MRFAPIRAIFALTIQALIMLGCTTVTPRGESSAVPATRDLRASVPDTQARLSALAQLQTLNAELLSHDSATATLERWCAAHQLASPARIEAERLEGSEIAPTAMQRRELGVIDSEVVRYRHVRLKCGTHVLSEAENWYIPARLTPQMNQLLDTTNTPFGKVVKPLKFVRHTLEAKLLWSPLPEGWEMSGVAADDSPLIVPVQVLQHRALLLLPDGTPFSEVIETYTSEVLAFPATRH